MGNQPGKPHTRERNKKYLQLKGAARPDAPGKPYLSTGIKNGKTDVLTIRWNPPESDGGVQLTGYIIEQRRQGSPNWTKASAYKVHDCELTISNLEQGWRYQFRVFAENIVGLSDPSELSEPFILSHQKTIAAPVFTKELLDAVVLENAKIEFVVHFSGYPTPKLCWFKDGFEIFSSRRTRILTEHDRSVLTIHQSAISDEGEIKCTATNKAGHISTRARLTIEAPPSIRLPRQYEDGLLFEIGEVLRLKVSIAGLPRPLIFWSHNGESINECERYEIENDGNSSTLRINEAQRTDRGEYAIRAVNKVGTDVTSFLVTVTDKPSPPSSAKVIMTLGRSVTLSWNTPQDDGGCKIGNYIVEYYRLGWDVWLKAATTKQLSTILGDLIEGSEYKFRIKAESPFGISEPSEETELIFIPDPKRGILQPSDSRSRSQSSELLDDTAPIATKRKKSRSQSSSRTGEDDEYNIGSPPRPARMKFASPPKSPEFSPKPQRKEQSSLNKAIFDHEQIMQELSYGSPDIRIKRTDIHLPKTEDIKTPAKVENIKQTTPKISSIAKEKEISKIEMKEPNLLADYFSPRTPSPRDRSPSPSHYIQKGDTQNFVKDKQSDPRKILSRDNSENISGSTEFMMVLYPEETKGGITSQEENDFLIPPPLSLSAPELCAEPPQLFDPIKYSASSTELLHERAMERFYHEAVAEEEAIKRKLEKHEDGRRSSLIPKIQINNQDESDITHLERKHSLRRRLSAGGTIPLNILNTQRRHSLRSTGEFSDIFGSGKQSLTIEQKREIMQNRQRSRSEEREEEEFERVRSRVQQESKSAPKKKITVAQLELWEDDEYIESLSEEELSEISEHESLSHGQKIREVSPGEEEDTYHPSMNIASKFEAPFEILTKPAKLPEPNFVPKPILKRKDNDEFSPPTSGSEMGSPRSRSNSLIDEYLEIQRPKAINAEEEKMPEACNTSAIAGAGLTAAGIIISQPILHKKEAEEAKSVIQHYGDIVRSHAQHSLRIDENPIRAALKRAAQMQARLHYSDEEEDEESKEPVQPIKQFDPPLIISKPPEKKPKPQVRPLIGRDDVYPKLQPIKPPDEVKAIQKITPVQSDQSIKELPPPIEEKPKDISRGREQTRFARRRQTPSKSPHHERRPPAKESAVSRGTSIEKPIRSVSKTRKASKSPTRVSSNAQTRSGSLTRPSSRSSSKQRPIKKSPSPPTMFLRKPKMCEIMTQTSVSDTHPPQSFISRSKITSDLRLREKAQVKVRNTIDYITDLAMFAVVIWVFLFSNELWAIPFLLVAVFRQLQSEIKRWIPQWIKKRWNKKEKE